MNRRVAVGLAVFLLAVAVRLLGLGDILTADEPQWIFRSQSFYRALATGDPGGTFQGTHPGVVPMLLIGGGIRLQEIFTGKLLVSPNVGAFRTAAKLPVALSTAAAIGLLAAFAAKLWGISAGASAGALLALEPFLVGHSQLAHVDALLALLMTLCLLSLLLALRTGARRLVLLSGFFGGLALLTKLPAVALVPVVLLAFGLHKTPLRTRLLNALLWVAAVGGVFLLLWPSMWVQFLPNLRYAGRDTGSVVAAEHGGGRTETGEPDPFFYLHGLLRRISPLTLLLGLGGLVALLRRQKGRSEALVLLGSMLAFGVLLQISGKRADRYLLPLLAIFSICAGVAAARLRFFGRFRYAAPLAAVLTLLLVNIRLSPAAVAFLSPLGPKEDLSQSGWGEGLEQAAAILNAHPLASTLTVAAWYPTVFQEFFRGQTMSLSSRHDPRVTFVVLYRNMRGRARDHPATDIWQEFATRAPYAVVRVAGRDMALIYAADSLRLFPVHAGEIVSPTAVSQERGTAIEVGQFIEAERDSLNGVRLGFATFSARPNTNQIVVHLRADADGPDLRTVSLSARFLKDQAWQEVFFDPVPNARGRTFYVAITSPNGRPGNAVTLQYQAKDISPGALVILRRPLYAGERRSDFRRAGDLAAEPLYVGE